MSVHRLNKCGASSLGLVPGLQFMPCIDFCNRVGTEQGYLQTTMNVSIFLSKLLIHPAQFFYLSTFLVRI
ncbi:hypothetical protein BK659_24570 [Pseudomonas brassicacearum]|uniref:Uncharacterized protein n=1 Tax=Pseudomonas brassicacearum TaxID=930166 RepID=A0A423GVK6_9PSED|nr:hypothetical protein BK659_24570 [Pseudomonas brassicacearum]